MQKHPRPTVEQPVAQRHPITRCSLKFCRLFTRGPESAAIPKTSPPAKRGWFEFASQSAIFVGPVGAMLLGSGSRWGFVIGLATQPFWFYTSFRHRQWGIFIASVFYAIGWAMGVYRNF
jgi:hypothetical protein